ncbi:MAG: hypothetical protein ABJD68_10760 [Nakamurella sp.]
MTDTPVVACAELVRRNPIQEDLCLLTTKRLARTTADTSGSAPTRRRITAAPTNRGTDEATDVVDLGPSVALQNTAMFAPTR